MSTYKTGGPGDFEPGHSADEEADDVSFPLTFNEACCVYSALYSGVVAALEAESRAESSAAMRTAMAESIRNLSTLVKELRDFLEESSHAGFVTELEAGIMQSKADGKWPVVLP